MIYSGKGYRFYAAFISIAFLLFFHAKMIDARILTQMTPTLTVSQKYTDNYHQTELNRDDQFITTYQLGFSTAFLERTRQLYINYSPKYIDFDTYNEKDSFAHAVQIDGSFQPDNYTDLSLNIGYDEQSDIDRGDFSGRSASVLATRQLFKHLSLSASHDFSRSLDQQVRTGEYKIHTRNITSTGLEYQFGKFDVLGFDYSYLSNTYEESDPDEYKSHEISGDISYWFSAFWGMDAALSYENTTNQFTTDAPDTLGGHLRFVKKITKQFDVYLKYAHSITYQRSGDHTVYHPSIGFDWIPDKNSEISIGIGGFIHKWESNPESDSNSFFIDANIYKNFYFSRRGLISVTGSSGYGLTDPEAPSLGFNTFYKAAILFDYQLTRRLTFNISSSYLISSFDEPEFKRNDQTFENTAGFNWNPLKWMVVNLSFTSTRFDTNSEIREDYKENQAVFSISIVPQTPLRMKE